MVTMKKFHLLYLLLACVCVIALAGYALLLEYSEDQKAREKADLLDVWLSDQGYTVTHLYCGCVFNDKLPIRDYSFSFALWYVFLTESNETEIYRGDTTFFHVQELNGSRCWFKFDVKKYIGEDW